MIFDAIIGLGQAGCALATEFADLSDYKSIVRIDSTDQENSKDNITDIQISEQIASEDYEAKPPKLKKQFKSIKGKVLFILAGAGKISMASLAILEQIPSKDITILYIRPDIEFLGAEAKLRENLVYNVFQEYARSGLFSQLYIVSNIMVEKAMGGVSIINYFEKINKTIVSTFHMLNLFQDLKPVVSTLSKLDIGTRLSTFGLIDNETKKEKMFFKLDIPTDVMYYFAYNESILKNDVNLLNEIKNMVKDKIATGISSVSYGIFATNYSSAFIICTCHTSLIQP